MKKSAIIFLTSLVVLLLVSSGFALADEHGKGNEKKNENGAQVTFQGDTKTIENKNKIMIKIKIDNQDNNGKNEHEDDDEDDNDDDDNTTVSPTPSPQATITPTVTPAETPTVTPTGTQQQVSINAKIKGTFASVDQFMTFLENLINTIKSALTPTG